MDRELWSNILYTFMPSTEMRDYLRDKRISTDDICHMICGSPVALSVKERYFKILADSTRPSDCNSEVFLKRCRDIEKAIRNLEELSCDSFFYLKSAWYDFEYNDRISSGDAPFKSLTKVKEYIRQELIDDVLEDDNDNVGESLCWWELELWKENPTDRSELINPYTYYFIGDEVMYFEKNIMHKDFGYWIPENTEYSKESIDSNLPVPYKAGDIVSFDITPFAPQNLGVILEIGDNKDCCCLQALVKNVTAKDGAWRIGAVKHNTIFSHNGMISPLYRIESFRNSKLKLDRVLLDVSRFIDGNESKGRALWNYISGRDIISEDIYKAIDELKGCLKD